MARRIEELAIIGDCQTVALVGIDGSMDWLCFPRFDSAACFAALLGGPEHGRWKIAPVGAVTRTTRAYRGETLVLETTFETDTGAVAVIDCMPIRTEQPDVVRIIKGLRGTVRMRMELVVRFDYGTITPWVKSVPGGVQAVGGPETLQLRTSAPLHGEGWSTVAELDVAAGEEVPFVLTWHPSHVAPPAEIDPIAAVDATAAWWTEWASRATYNGPFRDAVVRSLVTLKALTYAPTGGIVAAATTSLPEHIGGVRNWDYRYCWLRDATFTLSALIQSGYIEEARAWRDWLVRAVAGRGDELHIMYGLAGERRLPEMTLPWLPGFLGSQPVRIGNGAHDQFQLDVFGEVLDCLHVARRSGLTHSDDWRIERELMKQLARVWREPDEGIWEVRGPKRHFTHSKVMAWVAFDRAVRDAEQYGLPGPIDEWRSARDEVHAEICERAFDKGKNAFVQSYGSTDLDASVLVMAEVGFLPATDPRIVGTVAAIERELLRDGFVDRYLSHTGVDGLPSGEGAFLLCTFWLADNYALMGRREEAEKIFAGLLAIRNDVGLLAEEYDPKHRQQLGNFPQAFSHLALINTARILFERESPATSRRAP